MVKYPNVKVRLLGEDGNAFNLIGLTQSAIERDHSREAAAEFTSTAMACESYDALLTLIQETVVIV